MNTFAFYAVFAFLFASYENGYCLAVPLETLLGQNGIFEYVSNPQLEEGIKLFKEILPDTKEMFHTPEGKKILQDAISTEFASLVSNFPLDNDAFLDIKLDIIKGLLESAFSKSVGNIDQNFVEGILNLLRSKVGQNGIFEYLSNPQLEEGIKMFKEILPDTKEMFYTPEGKKKLQDAISTKFATLVSNLALDNDAFLDIKLDTIKGLLESAFSKSVGNIDQNFVEGILNLLRSEVGQNGISEYLSYPQLEEGIKMFKEILPDAKEMFYTPEGKKNLQDAISTKFATLVSTLASDDDAFLDIKLDIIGRALESAFLKLVGNIDKNFVEGTLNLLRSEVDQKRKSKEEQFNKGQMNNHRHWTL